MKVIKNLLMEAKAGIAFIITQILFKIIFESEGARILAESGSMQAYTIIIVFTIAWIVICLLCLANLKIGYLFAVIFGVVNLFPLVLLVLGIAPFRNRPYFNGWITLCLIYFSYKTYRSLKRGKRNEKEH